MDEKRSAPRLFVWQCQPLCSLILHSSLCDKVPSWWLCNRFRCYFSSNIYSRFTHNRCISLQSSFLSLVIVETEELYNTISCFILRLGIYTSNNVKHKQNPKWMVRTLQFRNVTIWKREWMANQIHLLQLSSPSSSSLFNEVSNAASNSVGRNTS